MMRVHTFMSTALRFRHHDEFHRSALYMAGAGPLAALVASGLGGGALMTIALASVAAIVAALVPREQLSSSGLVGRGILAGLGAALLVALSKTGMSESAPFIFAAVVAIPLAAGLRGKRLMVALAVGAASLLLARLAALQVIGAQELSSMPGWANAGLAGIAVSATSIFALLPRHVELTRDPVAAMHSSIAPKLSGEIAELVERSNKLWVQSKEELSEEDANRQILEEAVLRLMSTAKRWVSADSQVAKTSALSLAERMEALDKRIEEADDEVVVKQYEQARAALAEQMKYLSGIGKNRERVLARMHNYLAAMERLQLALANLASTTASREAVDLAPIVENLEELGQDIDSCSTALKELEA